MDNYKLQAEQARKAFLTYDHKSLARKLHLEPAGAWLQTSLFGQPYRISKETGRMEKWENSWVPAEGFGETMTLLDLVCDSREDRFVLGRYKSLTDFGLMFHRSLLEEQDSWADLFDRNPEGLRRACEALGGTPLPQGDISYALELFDGLPIALQFWHGDEEFPPNLRLLWDENSLQYIKYETMYFARSLLLHRIKELM